MSDDETDQVVDETPEEEQVVGEQSDETEVEPITPEKAYELAKAAQKGYTLTRQELSEIRQTLEGMKQAPKVEEKEITPQTWGEVKADLLESIGAREQAKSAEDAKVNKQIESELEILKSEGKIKTEEDENNLINFAIKLSKKIGYVPTLTQAYGVYEDQQKARKQGVEEGLKGKIKGEEGSKVGTSSKGKPSGEKEGVPYSDIHNKSIWDL